MTNRTERTYGVIFLGASRFPQMPHLNKASFATSKERVAEVLTREFLLADSIAKLDLFDLELLPIQIIDQIHGFLDDHAYLSDLIFYYCGHGSFLPTAHSYYLTLRTTRPGREATTGLQLGQVRIDLNEALFNKRIYLFLDCCYAGEAVKEWMSDGLSTHIAKQIEKDFPAAGTALLVAASRDSPAIAPDNRDETLFSGHLVRAIRTGIKNSQKELSLVDIADCVRAQIRHEPLQHQVMPEIHVPRQPHGEDVARLPLVRNIGFTPASSPPEYIQPFWSSASYNFRIAVQPASTFKPFPQSPKKDVASQSLASNSSKSQEADVLPGNSLSTLHGNTTPFEPDLAGPKFSTASQISANAVLGRVRNYARRLHPIASRLWIIQRSPARSATVAAFLFISLGLAYFGRQILISKQGEWTAGMPVKAAKGLAKSPHIFPGASIGANDSSIREICHPTASDSKIISPLPVGGDFIPATITIVPDLTAAKQLRTIAISPDRTKFATAGDDGLIRIWDIKTFKPSVAPLQGHNGAINSIAFSPTGAELASASSDGTVRLWSASTGEQLHLFDDIKQKAYSVAFGFDKNATYLLAGFSNGTIIIWNLRTYHIDGEVSDAIPKPVWSLSVAPDQSGDYVSGHEGTIWFHTLKYKTLPIKAHAGALFHVEYSADAQRVVSVGYDGLINMWSRFGEKIQTMDSGLKYLVGAAWSNDRTKLLTVGQGGSVQLWDAQRGEKLRAYGQPESIDVEAGIFGPTSSRFITVGEDKVIKVWSIDNEKEPILSIIGFADGAYVSYAANGCYDASPTAAHRFKVTVNGSENAVTPELVRSLAVPEGFSSVLAAH